MQYLCPICQKMKPATHFACVGNAKGGKAGTGQAKARTSEQTRAAVNARWAKCTPAKPRTGRTNENR